MGKADAGLIGAKDFRWFFDDLEASTKVFTQRPALLI